MQILTRMTAIQLHSQGRPPLKLYGMKADKARHDRWTKCVCYNAIVIFVTLK